MPEQAPAVDAPLTVEPVAAPLDDIIMLDMDDIAEDIMEDIIEDIMPDMVLMVEADGFMHWNAPLTTASLVQGAHGHEDARPVHIAKLQGID